MRAWSTELSSLLVIAGNLHERRTTGLAPFLNLLSGYGSDVLHIQSLLANGGSNCPELNISNESDYKCIELAEEYTT